MSFLSSVANPEIILTFALEMLVKMIEALFKLDF